MKLSSGTCSGMKLSTPTGLQTRPTSDKLRQAVMNILQLEISGAHFWDFFAGSGAMALEAISRGAAQVVFVENSKPALKCIQENMQEAKRRFHAQDLEPPNTQIISKDVYKVLAASISGDILWFDPPYKEALTLLQHLCQNISHIHCNRLLLELDSTQLSQAEELLTSHGLVSFKKKVYGQSAVLILTF